MTRSDKLDKILFVLLWVDKMELEQKPISKKITMLFINESSDLELEPWEMQSLKVELLDEGFMKISNDELRITKKGKKFITRQQGFKKLDLVEIQEDLIREKTIEKFKYDKFSFWFSILAIIISLLSLFLK
ncbi:hypothetical protein BC962_3120 [Gillisia mitskevichiae]|uniref:Uncharacterized protein n=1 Tax=Gillisia mitskevichiae TaxID=270921 RepID=A0A495NX51_9FLAO|nr:hypothetical protein [Gillisia mitskevichiae]RKS42663.1 hypothetical protein BC962_3120 [Gillisia mitskevichiae]